MASANDVKKKTLLKVLFALSLLLVLIWAADEARYRFAMRAVTRHLAAKQFAKARDRLVPLSAQRPRDGEALYLLGVCESELGRDAEARAFWERVAPGSASYGRAGVALARQVLQRHQFAEAETFMSRALGDEGPHAKEARETLVMLWKIEGRYEEARRLVSEAAGSYPDVIGLLRELAQLASIVPYTLDRVREGLDTAEKTSPNDDRVWLGRANLATRTGRFDEADQWLTKCEAKRPDDAAVVRARLQWAIARDDEPAARFAARRLPDGAIDPVEVLRLIAWFSARARDDREESTALKALLDIEPADFRALERLAELEYRGGRYESAAQYREKKAELERSKAEYDILLFLPDAATRSKRLAQLAEVLSRDREARLLWDLTRRRLPADPEAAKVLASPRIGGRQIQAKLGLADLRRLVAREGPTSSRPTDRTMSGTDPVFAEGASAAGLVFTFDNGATSIHHLPETMSGGLALLDYDGDGWVDVYGVQGGPFPPPPGAKCGDRLFRNRGDGTFEDRTEASGIAAMPGGYGHGVTVADYDNDGHPDLFVTRWRSYALYRNRGDGTFEDKTEAAGLGGSRDWPTSAAFADFDNDGDLDLYVCHYLDWDSEHPQPCWDERKQRYVYCGPPRFRSLPDHLFRNDGGRFVDVTQEAGIVDPHGQGLGVLTCDFDGDGLIDIFVANDQSANYLFRNLGGLRFEEVGAVSGVAGSAEGQYQAGMGVALGDPNGDGLPDIAVTNFYNEGTTFYQALGKGLFSDHTRETGLLATTRYLLGFGVAFLDANGDGLLDIASTNGHVDDFRPDEPYEMPALLLLGTAAGKWVDRTERAGPGWKVPRLGRGLAIGDIDNDGRPDVVILPQNAPLALLRNRTDGGRRLTLRLEGGPSNRDAIGARVTVTVSGARRNFWRFGGGSYQSSHDPRLMIGLGDADQADEVEVVWPSGRTSRFGPLRAGTGNLLMESAEGARRLAGFHRRAPHQIEID